MCELRKFAQDVQICELSEVVLSKDQSSQVRYRVRERRLYAIDSITGKEEGVQARGEREVGEGGDVVVCEVDCILVLSRPQHQYPLAENVLGGYMGPLQRLGFR